MREVTIIQEALFMLRDRRLLEQTDVKEILKDLNIRLHKPINSNIKLPNKNEKGINCFAGVNIQ